MHVTTLWHGREAVAFFIRWFTEEVLFMVIAVSDSMKLEIRQKVDLVVEELKPCPWSTSSGSTNIGAAFDAINAALRIVSLPTEESGWASHEGGQVEAIFDPSGKASFLRDESTAGKFRELRFYHSHYWEMAVVLFADEECCGRIHRTFPINTWGTAERRWKEARRNESAAVKP